MPYLSKLFLFADITGAGRFDAGSVSQQTAMEILCGSVKNLKKVQDKNGDFMPIERWKGLKFDSDGNLVDINFDSNTLTYLFDEGGAQPEESSIGPGGSMDLQWIPSTVTSFSIADLEMIGSLNTADLPRKLQIFDVSFNEFEGEIGTGGLPETLKVLNIQYNNFSGSLILAALPRGLDRFFATQNAFTGEIKLQDLPPQISVFAVEQNDLSGEISMRHIPLSIERLDLTHNDFGQDVLVVRRMARWKYRCIQIDKEKFEKIVDDEGDDISYLLPGIRSAIE